jgi:hypothetical protein
MQIAQVIPPAESPDLEPVPAEVEQAKDVRAPPLLPRIEVLVQRLAGIDFGIVEDIA